MPGVGSPLPDQLRIRAAPYGGRYSGSAISPQHPQIPEHDVSFSDDTRTAYSSQVNGRGFLDSLPSGQFVPVAISDLLQDDTGTLDLSNGNPERRAPIVPADPLETEDETCQPELLLMFKDANYKENALIRLNTMRKNKELCDVVFYINNRELYAHKAVLGAASPYLYDLFTGGTDPLRDGTSSGSNSRTPSPTPGSEPRRQLAAPETPSAADISPKSVGSGGGERKRETVVQIGKSKSYFEFNDIDLDCFEALIDYAYTAVLKARPDKVKVLYRLASMLKMQSCSQACAKYLVANLNPQNSVDLWLFIFDVSCLQKYLKKHRFYFLIDGIRKCANRTNDSLLASRVDAYIQQNFGEITQRSQEFTSLPCVQIDVVLSDEQIPGMALKLRDEAYIGEKVLRWIQNEVADLPEHIEFRMDLLTDKVHMLFLDAESILHDCCDVDDNSIVGLREDIKDYKRSARKGSSNQALHNSSVGGGKQKSSKFANISQTPTTPKSGNLKRFSSSDSIASLTSEFEEVEWKPIANLRTSERHFIGLAVIHCQLAALSVHIAETSLPASASQSQSTNASGFATPVRGAGAPESRGRSMSTGSRHSSGSALRAGSEAPGSGGGEDFGTPLVPLAFMAAQRCSVGAVNFDGRLVVCGGYDRGECLNSVEMYDIESNSWTNLPKMLKERGRFDATYSLGKIYAVGGSDGQKDLKSVESFDPAEGKWTRITDLPYPRSNNGCASVKGKVYSVGGWTGQAALRDVDRYDPETKLWTAAAPLNQARYQASCERWNERIFAVGGSDRWNCMNTVEMYDPVADTWTLLPKMQIARRGCGVAVLNDKLYVVGGSDGTQSLDTVEIFDLQKWTWCPPGPTLNLPRANVRALAIGNRVFAIGGFTGKVFLNSIEYMEEGGNEWRTYNLPPKESSTPTAAADYSIFGANNNNSMTSEHPSDSSDSNFLTPRASANVIKEGEEE